MSCSHPISSYTTAKYLYPGVNRWKQQFACGKCAGCISRQRTDWRVRAYYESLHTLRKPNSFILFDTLTYSDDYIPKYSDVFQDMNIPKILDKPCFSRVHVQKFFKRLRTNLVRDGYKYESSQLRYMLTSEYGSSVSTRGFMNTHRPHYHVLFYVSFPINPVDFSRQVSRAWYLGKTDGVRPYDDCHQCPVRNFCRGNCIYQSEQYVINERLVTNDSQANIIKCVNYVTKYVSKDLYNSVKLQDNVDALWRNMLPGYQSDYNLYRQYRRFCSQMLPFHLQSRYFGRSLLDDISEKDYIVKTNQVHLPTNDANVILSVSVPRYYQRQLYYKYKKVDGRVKWYLTDYGIDVKLSQLDSKIESYKRDYRAFDSTISDEALHMLSVYKNVYRGTLTDFQSLMLPYKQYYKRIFIPHSDDEQAIYLNRATVRDKLTIGKFLASRYVVSDDGEVIYKGKQLHREFLPYDGYVKVNDRCCLYWHGFDSKILNFERWNRNKASARDVIQSVSDCQVDYYRQLGILK